MRAQLELHRQGVHVGWCHVVNLNPDSLPCSVCVEHWRSRVVGRSASGTAVLRVKYGSPCTLTF